MPLRNGELRLRPGHQDPALGDTPTEITLIVAQYVVPLSGLWLVLADDDSVLPLLFANPDYRQGRPAGAR